MPKILNLTGRRFSRLVALQPSGARRQRSIEWECMCDCGTLTKVASSKLVSGETRSCGCIRAEIHTTHAMSSTLEYRIWSQMKERCYNPNNSRWPTHGRRGIKVCDRWRNSFENFIADMGARQSQGLSIERLDNDGDYTPQNCIWATSQQQAENRGTTRLIEIDGKRQSLKAWCREVGVPYLRTWKRIAQRGWEPQRAIFGDTKC